MPKFDLKQIRAELEKDLVWPVYWLWGREKMKSRELLKRIRDCVIKTPADGAAPSLLAGLSMSEHTFDGAQALEASILEAAQSMSLGGGAQFIVVKSAHLLKKPDELAELMGPQIKVHEAPWVCVFVSDELDGRRKFTKTLVDKAAVVACEEVLEAEREAWVNYLSKRKDADLGAALRASLCVMEPWSLDVVEREIEKFQLNPSDYAVAGETKGAKSDEFIEVFFQRDKKRALHLGEGLFGSPEDALPLLGLLSWNVRHFALWLSTGGPQDAGLRRELKMNPYTAERFRKWAPRWKLHEILALNEELSRLDFSQKQTPLQPLGLWSSLVNCFLD
ncbi:hypothetical protein WDW86_05235 [Bdellovibrionota bacterium FG-2]